MIAKTRFERVLGVREVRFTFPGPAGSSGGGTTASDPVDVIYMRCQSPTDDQTIHAVRLVRLQGYYNLQPDQTDSTP